jgi:hypothetical protein
MASDGSTSCSSGKRKAMDTLPDEVNVVSKIPRIMSITTFQIIHDRDPAQSESIILTQAQVNNLCKHSDYLREVVSLGSSSSFLDDNQDGIIILTEKDVDLAAQFLLILAQLKDVDSTAILPNLSYHLGFADLASKWIVGVYVTFFQNYIQTSLKKLCDLNLQPLLVVFFDMQWYNNNGMGEQARRTLYPAGSSDNVYGCADVVVEKSSESSLTEWRFKTYGLEYTHSANSPYQSLYRSSGEWKNLKYSPDYVFLGNHKTAPINFKLELVYPEQEQEFINIVKLIQAHEEYRHGTIFANDKLYLFLLKNPHLRSEKIMRELMSQEDLIQYSMTLTSLIEYDYHFVELQNR